MWDRRIPRSRDAPWSTGAHTPAVFVEHPIHADRRHGGKGGRHEPGHRPHPPRRRPRKPRSVRSRRERAGSGLVELRRRIVAPGSRWETVTMRPRACSSRRSEPRALLATEYDWRKCEARLGAAHFITEIDSRARHPLHPRALETQGRPAAHRHARMARLGREQMKIVDPLTKPTAHAGARRTPSTW